MGCGAAWLNFGLAACRQVRQLKVVQVATHDLKYRDAKSAFEWLFYPDRRPSEAPGKRNTDRNG